jgi:hypothetical protein
MSLGNLRQNQNRPDDARNLVRSSGALQEGFETVDLQVARRPGGTATPGGRAVLACRLRLNHHRPA